MGQLVETDDHQAEATNEQSLHRWRERELQRRLVEEADGRAETLAPPDAFSDTYAPETPEDGARRGSKSRTVEGLLGGGCCGWRERPDAAELYDAMRADQPTKRQMAVAGALISEADIDDLLMAHLEGAFTWRQLATMIHRLRMETSELSTYLNKRATRPRTPPPDRTAEISEGEPR